MNSVNLVIDLIVIAIITVCVLLSAKKGFVKTVVGVVGFIFAAYLTFTISTPLAGATYDRIIEPPIVEAAAGAVQNTQNDIWEALPEFITDNATKLGISSEDFKGSISSNLVDGAENAVKTASQDVIKPIIIKILGLLYSVVIMVVLMFVVNILASFINKLFSFSIVGKANKILGGIIGLPKGIIFAMLFCMIVSLIVRFSGGILFFTNENIDKTILFKFLANIIPFN